MRQAYKEKTCERIETHKDYKVYYYNQGVFKDSVADSSCVNWPITSMRSTVAYDMFEVFYPIELTITPPGCKSFSCEIGYVVMSKDQYVDKYMLYIEINKEEVTAYEMQLNGKTNEELLTEFEKWFEEEGLDDIYEYLS